MLCSVFGFISITAESIKFQPNFTSTQKRAKTTRSYSSGKDNYNILHFFTRTSIHARILAESENRSNFWALIKSVKN